MTAMSSPSISIIIPTYNREDYIVECLESARHQMGAPTYEIIVVNDGSTDGTKALLAKYGSITVIDTDKNSGLSVARNEGVLAARGEYLFFLDSDDKITPDALATLWRHVTAHPGVDMVFGQTVCFPDSKKDESYLDLRRTNAPAFTDNPQIIRKTYLNFPEIIPNRLIRRRWLTENNLCFTPGQILEDFDWQIRSLDFVKSFAVNYGSPTYLYRRDTSGSITSGQPPESKFKIIYDILSADIPKLSSLDRPVMRFIAHNLLEFKNEIRNASDNERFGRVCNAILSHPTAGRRHRRLVKLFKAYNRALPLRPVLALI